MRSNLFLVALAMLSLLAACTSSQTTIDSPLPLGPTPDATSDESSLRLAPTSDAIADEAPDDSDEADADQPNAATGFASDDPIERIEAIGNVIVDPENRQDAILALRALLTDTTPVPAALHIEWPFWPARHEDDTGTRQLIGEHAAFALHQVINGPNAFTVNFAQPVELWVAVDWIEETDEAGNTTLVPAEQRARQVEQNWATIAEANAQPKSGLVHALAGLYYYALDPCDPERDFESCRAMVHLLCNGTALWNERGAIVSGPWDLEAGPVAIISLEGGSDERIELALPEENRWPPRPGELTQMDFTGDQCP